MERDDSSSGMTVIWLYETLQFRDAARVLGKLMGEHEELSDVPPQLLMARGRSAMVDANSFNPVWDFAK